MPTCKIYLDSTLEKGQVSIPSPNDSSLKKGDYVVVKDEPTGSSTTPTWSLFARVTLKEVPPGTEMDIHAANWHGDPGASVSYEKISPLRYHLHVFTSSKRAYLGLGLMLVAVGLAYLNAALQTNGAWQWSLSPGKWTIFAASGVAAVGAYVKDVWF